MQPQPTRSDFFKNTQKSQNSLKHRLTNTNMSSLEYTNQNTRNEKQEFVMSKGSRLSSQKSDRELNDYQINKQRRITSKVMKHLEDQTNASLMSVINQQRNRGKLLVFDHRRESGGTQQIIKMPKKQIINQNQSSQEFMNHDLQSDSSFGGNFVKGKSSYQKQLDSTMKKSGQQTFSQMKWNKYYHKNKIMNDVKLSTKEQLSIHQTNPFSSEYEVLRSTIDAFDSKDHSENKQTRYKTSMDHDQTNQFYTGFNSVDGMPSIEKDSPKMVKHRAPKQEVAKSLQSIGSQIFEKQDNIKMVLNKQKTLNQHSPQIAINHINRKSADFLKKQRTNFKLLPLGSINQNESSKIKKLQPVNLVTQAHFNKELPKSRFDVYTQPKSQNFPRRFKKSNDQNPYQDIIVNQSVIFDQKSGFSDATVNMKSHSSTQGTQYRSAQITKRYDPNDLYQQNTSVKKPCLQDLKQRFADKIQERQFKKNTFYSTKRNSHNDWDSQIRSLPTASIEQKYKSIEASKFQHNSMMESNKDELQQPSQFETGRDSLFFETSHGQVTKHKDSKRVEIDGIYSHQSLLESLQTTAKRQSNDSKQHRSEIKVIDNSVKKLFTQEDQNGQEAGQSKDDPYKNKKAQITTTLSQMPRDDFLDPQLIKKQEIERYNTSMMFKNHFRQSLNASSKSQVIQQKVSKSPQKLNLLKIEIQNKKMIYNFQPKKALINKTMTKLLDSEFSIQRNQDYQKQKLLLNKVEETERTFREQNKPIELDNEKVMRTILRFQRIFGKEKNYPSQKVQTSLFRELLNGHKVGSQFYGLIQFIIQEFREEMLLNIDAFLAMEFEQYCKFKEIADNFNGDDYGDNLEKSEFNQEPIWSIKMGQNESNTKKRQHMENKQKLINCMKGFSKNRWLSKSHTNMLQMLQNYRIELIDILGVTEDDLLVAFTKNMLMTQEIIKSRIIDEYQLRIAQTPKDEGKFSSEFICQVCEEPDFNHLFTFQMFQPFLYEIRNQERVVKKAEIPTIRTVKKRHRSQTQAKGKYQIDTERSFDDSKIISILKSSKSPIKNKLGKASFIQQKYKNLDSFESESGSDSSWISVKRHEFDCQCSVCFELEPDVLYQQYQDELDGRRREHDPPEQLYQRSKEILENPLKANSIEEAVDLNLEYMMQISEYYEDTHDSMGKKQELNEIKGHAKAMLKELKDISSNQRLENLKNIEGLKTAALAKKFVGQNKAYLIDKFLSNLRSAVQERKDQTILIENQNIVKEIFKKNVYNKTYQNSEAAAMIKDESVEKIQIIKTAQDYIRENQERMLRKLERQRERAMAKNEVLRPSSIPVTPTNDDIEHLVSPKNKLLQTQNSIITSLNQGTTEREEDKLDKTGTSLAHLSSGLRKSVKFDKGIFDNQKERGTLMTKESILKKLKQRVGGEYQEIQSKLINKEVVSGFIQNALQTGKQPLPILNRITDNGEIYLINYKMNDANAEAFADSTIKTVPKYLRKIILIDNALTEETLAYFFQKLGQRENDQEFDNGIVSLTCVLNDLGQEAFDSLQENFLFSGGTNDLKKLIFKLPTGYARDNDLDLFEMFDEMAINFKQFPKLRKLTVSSFILAHHSLDTLAIASIQLPNLQFLDISGNKLDSTIMNKFFKTIKGRHKLRHLNIGYNTGAPFGQRIVQNKSSWTDFIPEDKFAAIKVDEFIKTLADFMHHSETLIHIDISGLSLSYHGVHYVIRQGLARSRTLQSCHFGGCNIPLYDFVDMTKHYLKIEPDAKQYQVCNIQIGELRGVFAKEPKVVSINQFFTQNIRKVQGKIKQQSKAIINKPLLQFQNDDRSVFHRVLGHSEVYRSHKWQMTSDHRCKICNKLCYCIFVWNKSVQESQFGSQYYKRSMNEPFEQKEGMPFQYPTVYINGQVDRMMPIEEFFDRLQNNKNYEGRMGYKPRACNNEQEEENFSILKQKISLNKDITETLLPTYWSQSRALYRMQREGLEKRMTHNFSEGVIGQQKVNTSWASKLEKLIPPKSFQAINLRKYEDSINAIYQKKFGPIQDASDEQIIRANLLKEEALRTETYFIARFVPCHHDYGSINEYSITGNRFEVAIKDHTRNGVDYLLKADIDKVPNKYKNLSLNTMKLYYKQTKKMKEVRNFNRPKSVFGPFKFTTEKLISKGFEKDAQYIKTHKFIKDQKELNDTLMVLKKYYRQLKDQFQIQIATPKNYPVIGWLDYVNTCNDWGIIGEGLTGGDIDRTFIATNFEEVDLENNDDKSLCRYEFLEIIARLGKIKYYDTGVCNDIAKATEKLIVEFILPYSGNKMSWQEFRDDVLWTLEVDDIIKANKNGLDQIYKLMKDAGAKRGNVSNQDCIDMLANAGLDGVTQENRVAIAYSMSKSFIADEMEEFDNYFHLKQHEYYEFLGRMAELIYEDQQISLRKKLEQLIPILLTAFTKVPFALPDETDDIQSDSDYEDDVVDEILTQLEQEQYQ